MHSRLILALVLSIGCSRVDTITPPSLILAADAFRIGEKAVVNTGGSNYDGLFDGKIVKVVGHKNGLVECEYIHGDHTDMLRLKASELRHK